ncbi:uncharacterized protein LOC142586972 [Dermacentor variabilis]|uniref:uncharacterized protein LOC142586972 n=1 Tax=Dermacentor variabilis TaxID=34621 RepID=UPI003F5C94E5
MMGLTKFLGVIAFFSSSCAAMLYRTDDPCNFSGVRLDDEMFSKLLANLPEDLEYGPEGFHSLLPGIDVSRRITMRGLKKLRPFGAPIPYCAKGKRMVQVDFYNIEPIEFSTPFKTCSGQQGELLLRSMFVRFTAQFTIAESTGEGVNLKFKRALPVTTQTIRVVVKGLGPGVHHTVEALSALLPSVLQEAWDNQFPFNIGRSFSKALE